MNVLFLPGAGGDPAFWQPVADRLPGDWQKTLLGWPGLGDQPASADINGWDDLRRMVERHIDGPVALVAQSMGGVLAMHAALANPRAVSHLVLTATSAGIDLTPFEVQDWREEYRLAYPGAPAWVYERPAGHDAALHTLAIPTLLIWATRDVISPPGVGRRLAELLPTATLVELDDDDHMFARERPDEVAGLVVRHLSRP